MTNGLLSPSLTSVVTVLLFRSPGNQLPEPWQNMLWIVRCCVDWFYGALFSAQTSVASRDQTRCVHPTDERRASRVRPVFSRPEVLMTDG